MIIQAELKCKQTECEADPCAVDKVIELPSPRFRQFSRALLADYDFIAENKNAIRHNGDARHCLLILDAEGTDGFLIDPQGYNYARYLRRLEEETEPAVRELLERDMAHLDAIQFSSASSRKFVLVLPLDEKAGADESALRQLEKTICDHGLRVRLAEEQDVKRLLAIYYRQDLTTEVFRDFDGEEYVHG